MAISDLCAHDFAQDVLADCEHKGSEAFRLQALFLSQNAHYPKQSFLPDVLHQLRRFDPAAQIVRQQSLK
jgi:hypothetical protein